MTITGSGVGGGNLGGPMQPMQREIEATAWTVVNKAALGILPDSLEVPFTQLGGNPWKYQSDANRPALKSLATIRPGVPNEEASDDSWKNIYDNLVAKLHPQLKKRMLDNFAKPFNARNVNYSVFENLLAMTAKGMAWLEKAQEPMDPESPQWERTEHNQALPGKALRGIVGHSKTMLMGTKAFLNYVGPNHPHHDELNQFEQEGEEIQSELNEVLKQIQNGEIPSQDILNRLAKNATSLNSLYQRVYRGNDMQIMGPMLEAMEVVANAFSLTPTTPSLFFGLKMATQGLFSRESELGMLGEAFEALMKALTTGTLSTMMNKVPLSKKMLLMMLMLGMTSGASTLAGLLAEFGIGPFPKEQEGDETEGNMFTFQIILDLLVSSGLIKTAYKIAIEASGGDEKAQEMIGDVMELANLLLMALTGTKGQPKNAGILLEGVKNHLKEKINSIESFVLTAIRSGIENPALAKSLDVALKQAKIALDKEDFEAFMGSCGHALELLNTNSDLLKEDLSEMKELAKLLNRSCVPETKSASISLMRSG